MEITREIIKSIYPYKITGMKDSAVNALVDKFIPPLNKNLGTYGINTPLRIAHFLAQMMHESGGFRFTKELASGAAYDTGRLAAKLGNTTEADGDGQKYKGRGLVQITGRNNYKAFCLWLGGAPDVYRHPELVEQPNLAVLAAIWYWDSRKLNLLADKDDLNGITKIVNGGYNGLAERRSILVNAKKVLL